jgi:hypothetical protein
MTRPLPVLAIGTLTTACFLLTISTGVVLAQRADQLPLRLAATAVNSTGVGDGKDLRTEITITRWTTADERAALLSKLAEGGSRELMLALTNVPSHGKLRMPEWQGPDPHKMLLGWDLRYAWQEPQADGTRRIVLGTDRYISIWESREKPGASDYPFTLLEIRLDGKGVGTGKASAAARLTVGKDKQAIELENYAAQPVMLKDIRIQP